MPQGGQQTHALHTAGVCLAGCRPSLCTLPLVIATPQVAQQIHALLRTFAPDGQVEKTSCEGILVLHRAFVVFCGCEAGAAALVLLFKQVEKPAVR